MKTKGIILCGLAGLFASCASQTCEIQGTVEGAQDGDTLFMARISGGNFMPTDTIILKDGKFSLSEPCDSTVIASYFYHNKHTDEVYSNVFFMESGTVRLSIGAEGKVSGTQSNDIYQQLSDSIYAVHKKMNDLFNQQATTDEAGLPVTDEDTEKKLMELDRQANQIVKRNVETHIGTACGYFLLLSCYNLFEPQEIIDLAAKVPAQFQNDEALLMLTENASRGNHTANGKKFVDVTIPSIDGGQLTLSEVVSANKLTLVDCWASWCSPCRAEMPHVVELYKKYRDKGLEIVGISFDENETEWKEAVKQMEMTWPQASELNSWENVMTQQYNVTSIPYTILIDQSGTIIAQQLRGMELEEVIKAHLE